MKWIAALALILYGCPQSIATPDGIEDAGPSAADATNGGEDAAPDPPDSTTAQDDAGVVADADTRDAEPTDNAGPLGALNWAQMTVPENTRLVEAIWGFSSTEIYAGTMNGELMRFDPQSGWTNVWHEPSNFAIHAIWGAGTTLFVASDTTLHVHENGVQQTPRSFSVGRWIYDVHGASENEVYIVSDRQNGRALYKYDGDSVDLLIEPAGVAQLSAVFSPAAGTVFFGGNGHLFRYESFTNHPETVDWPTEWDQSDILNFYFDDISPVGAHLFAIGSRYLIFERDGSGFWSRVHSPFLTGSLHALAGFGEEAYAVGEDVTGGSILRYYLGTWTTDHYDNNVDLYDIWAAGPDEYYVAGTVNNTFDGLILRGTR